MIFRSQFSGPRKAGEYWLDAISLFLMLMCATSSMSMDRNLAMWCFILALPFQAISYGLDEMVRVKIFKIGPQGLKDLKDGTMTNPDFKSVPPQAMPGPQFMQNAPQNGNFLVARGNFRTLLMWRTIMGFIAGAFVVIGFISAIF
ncbi:MAG: hypothetical protein J6P35_01100 [Aeriscardovia sp.]|nr:hypothetical protein [Aeriscardovia sp.]